ncbi:tetratricopeptide repeat protein [Lysobacter solisilvae (ex Woo and Kim 2020)]|uniref:Tetratricopeptide repeat protein n=1 Tax=Agrilutibacter terrestris TaxID=2865112 RepID=A0A7H0G119_9GAMM|nr:tetratricopeptide repeat protein [Lysobacter terrestris]QNP41985.1 tetratricopeptide repeat protein [Lysobacter terrestris]
MTSISTHRTVLAAAVAAVLAFGAVSQVHAQSAAEQRRADREAARAAKSGKSDKKEVAYPNATRKEPGTKASAKAGPKLQKMMKLYDSEKPAEARAAADEIIANESFNAYDRAFAAQIAAQIAYEADDSNAAVAYLDKALAFDGLDNNGHYNAMLMKAQLQLQDDKYAEGLVSIDRFLNESKSTNPEHLVIKGNALYRMEKYPEAAAVLKQAVDASPDPRADWQQLLMAAYAESGQGDQAIAMAEKVAAKSPADKRAQMNLAAVYLQADKYDKAAATLEKLRAAGQLTDDRDYRQLYSTYLNLDGKEKQAAEVIKEGLDKGILKPDHQVYLALAQSYYFSEQPIPAIDAYKKAAPLDDDGETYLNLARLLWQEERVPEAKEAAKQAIAKGLKKPDDAKKILALPSK